MAEPLVGSLIPVIDGSTFTIDAMHSQKETAHIVVEELSVDSTIQSKDTQGTFHYPNKAKPSSQRSYYVSSRDPTDWKEVSSSIDTIALESSNLDPMSESSSPRQTPP